MSLPPNFRETLSEKLDDELYELLDHSGDYLPEAVDAAKNELIRRNLSVDRAARIQTVPEPVVKASRRQAILFFRWGVARVVLWLLGGLYALLGIVTTWIAIGMDQRSFRITNIGGHAKATGFWWSGAVWDFIIAALCIFAWYLMRRRTPTTLSAGALVVATGLLLTVRPVVYAGSLNPHYPWIEPLFVWPFLLYSVVYGFLASRVGGGSCNP